MINYLHRSLSPLTVPSNLLVASFTTSLILASFSLRYITPSIFLGSAYNVKWVVVNPEEKRMKMNKVAIPNSIPGRSHQKCKFEKVCI